ncbi:MAG: response regulator transcription factor [Gemmatimonadota bacterium]
MKILIAEDDPTSTAMLGTILRQLGHEVVATDNGEEALHLMGGSEPPEMALLDWEMPGFEGPEVCEALRARGGGHRPYLIMLTARRGGQDLVEAFDAGADDFVTKPFAVSELRARIHAGAQVLKLQRQLADKIEELQSALSRVRSLEGILPICMHCKRIRDSGNYWQQVEVYMAAHSGARFTHGLCEECLAEHYPEDPTTDLRGAG